MKVKLLKKVRKRFSINYYPNGFNIGDRHSYLPAIVVIDNDSREYPIVTYFTIGCEDVSFYFKAAKMSLLVHICFTYSKYGTRRKSDTLKKLNTFKKLWHNGN